MTDKVRHLVSKKKKRLQEDGFDLDMAYIGEKLLAMGFPSVGVEAKYRNPYSQVIKFLDQRHKDKYRVYNLCSERGYDSAKFYDRVGLYPFDDHNAPPFKLLVDFCEDVHDWLAKGDDQLAVIHCKAGKGRTGCTICCYLLYCKMFETADEAMTFYGNERTYNGKGVTIPSQIRYVNYFEHYMKHGMPNPKTLALNKLQFNQNLKVTGGEVHFTIYDAKKTVLASSQANCKSVEKTKIKQTKGKDQVSKIYNIFAPLQGDVKFEFKHHPSVGSPELLCTFWINTNFIDGHTLTLTQPELDRANKDTEHKRFPDGFTITLEFDDKFSLSQEESADAVVSPRSSILNDERNEDMKFEGNPRTPLAFSMVLIEQAFHLYSKRLKTTNFTATPDTPIPPLARGAQYRALLALMGELRCLDLSALPNDHKLAFWLNTYQSLLLFTYTLPQFSPPTNLSDWLKICKSAMYDVGGHAFSLLQIITSVVRGKLCIPDWTCEDDVGPMMLPSKFNAKYDQKAKLAVTSKNPLIHFIIPQFTLSGPSPCCYNEEKINDQINRSASLYLSQYVVANQETTTVTVPRLVKWCRENIGKKDTDILKWAADFMDPENKKFTKNNSKSLTLEYANYDWRFHFETSSDEVAFPGLPVHEESSDSDVEEAEAEAQAEKAASKKVKSSENGSRRKKKHRRKKSSSNSTSKSPRSPPSSSTSSPIPEAKGSRRKSPRKMRE